MTEKPPPGVSVRSLIHLKAPESFTSVYPHSHDLSAGPLGARERSSSFECLLQNINRGRVAGEKAALHPAVQEVFQCDCSWSISTAVAMIAVIIALMKKASKGGGWECAE
ncbi:hypothetical protein CgunFtcFv8_016399 [Champsocephalus gunnari]|uniref:Uncharacterized protein n=1 Tax=Champsocephalus gunnari TaxID=52237 RepID=A0AAN8CR08_CHAGU|nr:hypothetical protein CgunFtcFv8_016399 [Champsocephalus gunnari]